MVATDTYRIEVDLSHIAEGERAHAGGALVRAMLEARGGAFAMPGVFDNARLIGDMLILHLAASEELIREMVADADIGMARELADLYDLHEDCRTEDELVEAHDEGEKEMIEDQSDAFEAVIDRLLAQDAGTDVRDLLRAIKAKYDEQGHDLYGSLGDAFTVLGLSWKA